MDEAWEGFASSYRKKTDYLETVREQVSVLEKAVDFETVEGLVDDFEKHKEQTPAIAEAYNAGDTEALVAAQFPPDSKRAAVHKKLIELRNDRWGPRPSPRSDRPASRYAPVGSRLRPRQTSSREESTGR